MSESCVAVPRSEKAETIEKKSAENVQGESADIKT